MGEDSGYFSRRSYQFRLPTRKHHHQHTDTNNYKKKSSNGCGCNATTSSVANCINKNETITSSDCCDSVTAVDNYNNTSIIDVNCSNNNCHSEINSKTPTDRCCSYGLQCGERSSPVEQNILYSRKENACSLSSQNFDVVAEHTDPHPSNTPNNPIKSCPLLVNDEIDTKSGAACTANFPCSLHSRPVHEIGSSTVDTGSSSSCGAYYTQINSCDRTTFSPNSILHLKYTDLNDSNTYRNLSYVFKDEQDFEEFKQELKNFQSLKESLQENVSDYDYQASSQSGVPVNSEEELIKNNRLGNNPRSSPILTSINHQNQRNNNNICNDQNANCLEVREATFSTRNPDRIFGTDILPAPLTTSPTASSNLRSSAATSSSNQPHRDNTCIASSSAPSNSSNKARITSIRRLSSNSSHPLKYLSSSSRNAPASHDMLMDFFKSDENFQEFDREFANLGSDFNVFGRLGRIEDNEDKDEVFLTEDRQRDAESEGRGLIPVKINIQQDNSVCPREHTPLTELRVKHGSVGTRQDIAVPKNSGKNDTFSDFFDNDEDFREFEREFANFKLRRRSRAFADDFNRRSNCDLFADLFPKFESQEKIERRNRGSASDWDYLFNKIKRNSGFLTDVNELQGTPREISQNPTFLAIQNPKRTSEDVSTSHSETNESPVSKPIEIVVQRRPPLPPLVPRHSHTPPDGHQSPSSQKKPLELKIEHVSSPIPSNFRTDSPLSLTDSVGSINKRLSNLKDEKREESDLSVPPTVLHIDEVPISNNPATTGATADSNIAEEPSHIIIEHRFTGGVSKPTFTITRRTNKSIDEGTGRESPVSIHPQQLSELRDKRRHTDPPRIIIEHRFSPRELEPGSSKQNRFSTALEFLHDVDSGKAEDNEKPHKDCKYTCHKTCRQLVTLDCANNLPNSTSDGSIETSLSEPASTPGSNSTVSDALSNDETDSGYRSGPIPDEILPKREPSEATLNREELRSKLQEYNNNVPNANLALDSNTECPMKSTDMDSGCSMESNDFGLEHSSKPTESKQPSTLIPSDELNSYSAVALTESDSDFDEDESINLASNESDGETFQGFIKVTLNLIRPITMSLGARPPSIYEVLTREHIVEQNTQSISFYMPRDTVKSIHVDSETTTKEVIAALLKKFKILDNPRKFAMYEQEFKNKKLVKLRRVMPEEFPLQVCLGWETNKLESYRLVLQENEASGDIEWSNFSHPELNNFVKVLDREETEHIQQLQYKYHMMKKAVERRMKEVRAAEQNTKHSK